MLRVQRLTILHRRTYYSHPGEALGTYLSVAEIIPKHAANRGLPKCVMHRMFTIIYNPSFPLPRSQGLAIHCKSICLRGLFCD